MNGSKYESMGSTTSTSGMEMMRRGVRGPRAEKQTEKGTITKFLILKNVYAAKEDCLWMMMRMINEKAGSNAAGRSRLGIDSKMILDGPQSRTGQCHGMEGSRKKMKIRKSNQLSIRGYFGGGKLPWDLGLQLKGSSRE